MLPELCYLWHVNKVGTRERTYVLEGYVRVLLIPFDYISEIRDA